MYQRLSPGHPALPEALPKAMNSLVVRNCSLIDIFAKCVHVDWSCPTRSPMASMVTLLEFELMLIAVRWYG